MTMTKKLTTLQRMAGLSLIELMIAMTISSILLIGVTSIYFSSRESDKFTSELSRLQETGRQALDFLSRELRMAGYIGCFNTNSAGEIGVKALNSPSADFRSDALVGFEVTDASWVDVNLLEAGTGKILRNNGEHFLGATFLNDANIGSDVIAMQRTSINTTDLVNDMVDKSVPINIVDNTHGFTEGDIAVIASCQNADIFRISNDPNAGGGVFTLAHDLTVNSELDLQERYNSTNGKVMRLNSILFFVGDTGRVTAKGAPINALYRVTDIMTNSLTPSFIVEELIEGVDNMQILYGEVVRIDVDAVNEEKEKYVRYVTADRVSDMQKVESIRLGLLLSGTLDVLLEPDDTIYNLPGATIGPEGEASASMHYDTDRRLRREFIKTINLRNRQVISN